ARRRFRRAVVSSGTVLFAGGGDRSVLYRHTFLRVARPGGDGPGATGAQSRPRPRVRDAEHPAAGRVVSQLDPPADVRGGSQRGPRVVDAAAVSAGDGDVVPWAAVAGGFVGRGETAGVAGASVGGVGRPVG